MSLPQQQPSITRHVLAMMAIMALVLAAFSCVRRFEFVGYDDPIYIGLEAESRMVSEGVSLAGLRWIWTATAASLWEPLNYLSHMVDVQLWGNEPTSAPGHHLASLAIHIANGLLAYWFLFRLTGNLWGALLAAALFAVHPMRAESVAWISERKGLLCALFVLMALISYLEYAKRQGTQFEENRLHDRDSRRWMFATVMLTALAMMSKPAGVVVPVLAGLMDMWPLRRCGFDEETWDLPRIAMRQLREKWPLVLMAGGLAIVSVLIQYGSHEEKFIGALGAYRRLYFAPAGILFYLQRTFWPSGLTIEYDYPRSTAYVAAGYAIVFAVTYLLVQYRDRCWPLLFGWLWFLVCWLPVSGLVHVGTSFTTDRYTYLPHIGLMAGLLWQAGEEWKLRFENGSASKKSQNQLSGKSIEDASWPMMLGCGLVVLALVPVARRQAETWQSNISLFEQAIRACPSRPIGYTNLGVAYEKMGRYEAAIPLLEKSVELGPTYTNCYNLARVYGRVGDRRADAARLYQQTLELNPGYSRAWHNLGLIKLRSGDQDEALRMVRKANELESNQNSNFLNTLAEVHFHRKEFAQALTVSRQALSLPIGNPQLRQVLVARIQKLTAQDTSTSPTD